MRVPALDGTVRIEVDGWPDLSWRRLFQAVLDPDLVWATVPRCPACGRPLAQADCDPDPQLCWNRVTGRGC